MAAVSANKLELLQIADAVAREKSIDRSIVIAAMEDAIQTLRACNPTDAPGVWDSPEKTRRLADGE